MQEFKLIVAGGRDFANAQLLSQAICELANGIYADKGISIVTGMAKGADSLGHFFAIQHNVAKYKFPADWIKYGKGAGFIRNKQMGDFADGLLAFQCRDNPTPGTAHMIKYMQSLGKPVHIIYY